ncbi:hypothetical protein C8J57DRAFT_1223728 [Mycena rebaudengoi]|nr:hypothetical protein C8J57DRAFT_1223728 [Mycena rebaudengoi]
MSAHSNSDASPTSFPSPSDDSLALAPPSQTLPSMITPRPPTPMPFLTQDSRSPASPTCPTTSNSAPSMSGMEVIQELYSLEDCEAAAQFMYRQRTGTKPPPDYPLPHDEPYTAAARVTQHWCNEFVATGDVAANPLSLVGALSACLRPHRDREGRACEHYVTSAKLHRADDPSGQAYSETGVAVVLWYPDPIYQQLRWFLGHPGPSVNSIARSLRNLQGPDFLASTFPINSTNLGHTISIHPIAPEGVPSAYSILDPDPLLRTPNNIHDPPYAFLPVVSHPHDTAIQILNSFLVHDQHVPRARFLPHLLDRHERHLVQQGWIFGGQLASGKLVFLEPAPEGDEPSDATFPPHLTQYMSLPQNYWMGVQVTHPARGRNASERLSIHELDEPIMAQVPDPADPQGRPVPTHEHLYPLTLADTFRLEHNLPGEGVSLPDDLHDDPCFRDGSEPSSTNNFGDDDSDDSYWSSGSEEGELIRWPPHPPRSPPPPPCPATEHPTTPLSPSPEPVTGLIKPDNSTFIKEHARWPFTSTGLAPTGTRLPTHKEEDEHDDEHDSTLPSTPMSPLLIEGVQHLQHPIILHLKLSTLAHAAVQRLQEEQGELERQPPAPILVQPHSAPAAEYGRQARFYGGRDEATEVQDSIDDASSITNSSISSREDSVSSCDDVSLYSGELEYPPTPSLPDSTPLYTTRPLSPVLHAPQPIPSLPDAFKQLTAVAHGLIPTACSSPMPRATTPVSAQQTTLKDIEASVFLPPRPMSALRNPLVLSIMIPEMTINPYLRPPCLSLPEDRVLPLLEESNSTHTNEGLESQVIPARRYRSRHPAGDSELSDDESYDPNISDDAEDGWETSSVSLSTDSAASSTSSSVRRAINNLEGRSHGSLVDIHAKLRVDLAWLFKLNPPIASFCPMRNVYGNVTFGRAKDAPADLSGAWTIGARVVDECFGPNPRSDVVPPAPSARPGNV